MSTFSCAHSLKPNPISGLTLQWVHRVRLSYGPNIHTLRPDLVPLPPSLYGQPLPPALYICRIHDSVHSLHSFKSFTKTPASSSSSPTPPILTTSSTPLYTVQFQPQTNRKISCSLKSELSRKRTESIQTIGGLASGPNRISRLFLWVLSNHQPDTKAIDDQPPCSLMLPLFHIYIYIFNKWQMYHRWCSTYYLSGR